MFTPRPSSPSTPSPLGFAGIALLLSACGDQPVTPVPGGPLFAGAGPATTTYTVNSADDTDDGACNTAHCSLREAIRATYTSPGTDSIHFAIPGAGPHTIRPATALPSLFNATLDGYTQAGASANTSPWPGGTNAVLMIVVDGTGLTSVDGIRLGDSTTVRGLVVTRFRHGTYVFGDDVAIEGNFIGVDPSGATAAGNEDGVFIINGSRNRIGGTSPAARNLIAGNTDEGVQIFESGDVDVADDNIVQGNLIGTDRSGTAAVPNGRGVAIEGGTDNAIGGAATGAGNLISGNTLVGVALSTDGQTVQGNFIGTNAAGSAALANNVGIAIVSAGNGIGGPEAGARNVVSGNTLDGIRLSTFGQDNVIAHNLVGTNAAGTGALGNGGRGILMTGGPHTLITGNVISANGAEGVTLQNVASLRTVLQGNVIGLTQQRDAPLGNTGAGIDLFDAFRVVVGGADPGEGNVIAYNGGGGVRVRKGAGSTGTPAENGLRNALLVNAIFANTGLGIDLDGDGVTPNDYRDPDAGPNLRQNFPTLSSAVGGTTLSLQGQLRSESGSRTYRILVYANGQCDPSGNGEGERFVGAFEVTSDTAGLAPIDTTLAAAVAAGEFITATAADPDSNTSEFSACRGVESPNNAPTADAGGPYTGEEGRPIALALSGSDPDGDALSYAWNLGDGTTGSGPTPPASHTYADNATAPATFYTITLTVRDGRGGSDTRSTTATVGNVTPTATFTGPGAVDEGSDFTLELSGALDVAADLAGLEYRFDCGPGFGPWGASSTRSCPTGDEETRAVTAQVRDKDGGSSSYTGTVVVENVAPTATFAAAGPVEEGTAFSLALSDPRDVPADLGELEYRFDCGLGFGPWGAALSQGCPTDDNATRPVAAEVRDQDGGISAYAGAVEVLNVAPTLGAITVPPDPVPTGTPVTLAASFSDPGTADSHAGYVQWGAGASFDPALPGVDPAGHTVSATGVLPAGVYTVALRVLDDDGGEDTRSASTYVVVYDPSEGFVTGGGWLDSPLGAYGPDPSLTGKATFGFVARYEKGAQVPTGGTEFQFAMANLRFKSRSYEWLVVAGAQAKFKGTGTVNGAGAYGFMVTAFDGAQPGGHETDALRIKIWDLSSGTVVYDNRRGEGDDAGAATELGGGSIVIHK